MTMTQIRKEIQKIKNVAKTNDYEKAHGMEDELYRGFVEAIAKGKIKKPGRRAQEILRTRKIKYARYSA
jgi:acetolactate synthase small subunit